MPYNDRIEWFGAQDITADYPSSRLVQVGGENFTFNSQVQISVIGVGKGTRFVAPVIMVDGIDSEDRNPRPLTTWFDAEGRLCVWTRNDVDEWLKEQVLSYYHSVSAFGS